MKRPYIFILLTVSSLLASSCGRYLDVQPQGKVIPQTEEEFASIIHNRVNSIEGGEDQYIVGNYEGIIMYESFSDNLDANVKVGSIPAYAGDKINQRQTAYRETFAIIRDCNIVVENMEQRGTVTADQVVSAAYAIKGVCYYNLIRDYCEPYDESKAMSQLGLPLIDKFDMEERPGREPLKTTVEYALSLLDKSLSYHVTDKKFIFTEDVVKAYKAKLLFWVGRYGECASLCEELLAKPAFRLCDIDDYEEMIQAKNAQLDEVIVRSHVNNSCDLDWYYSMLIKDVRTRPVNVTLVRLFDIDKEKDVRYAVSFDKKRLNNKNTSAKVRGAELVLMLAECYVHDNKPQQALEQLNYLRRSRIRDVEDYTMETLPPFKPEERMIKVDAQGKTLTPLLSAIFDERRKELYLEADRWFELKRNGRPVMWIINGGLKYTTEKYLYTAPIYKGDVDLNPEKMIQNEGYVY